MKTIKIIDLLNKIVNGEEVPEKIKYNGRIYTRFQNLNSNRLYYYQVLNESVFLIDQISSVGELLNEVELIEEDNKIEKLNYDFNVHCNEFLYNALENKINELIDEVNALKENNKWH